MNKPIVKVDLFREIVEKTQNAIVGKTRSGASMTLLDQLIDYDPKITGIHYHHGHPIEIDETLIQAANGTGSKFKRFPLIALFQPFTETMSTDGFYSDDVYHLIIARGTEAEYKASKRYEVNFKPILYPIYFQFMEQIRLSKYFEIVSGDSFPHVKIDMPFYGKKGDYGSIANIFSDKVDCIDIENLKLRVKTKNC